MKAITCRSCGRELTDAVSRRLRIGPDCREGMTDDELAAALRLTQEEAQPGYIPPARAATPQARHTNAAARAVVAIATAPKTCARHGGLVGACAQCRQEADPDNAAARIIRAIKAERAQARRG